jgi:hypothetical protein
MDATDRVGMDAEVRLDGQMSARAIDDGGCATIERRLPGHARRAVRDGSGDSSREYSVRALSDAFQPDARRGTRH